MAPTVNSPTAPIIYRLVIERFRGISAFSWNPTSGANILLGGGDVGKTTILEAIALLLSPTNPTTLMETDYYDRNTQARFAIDAVMSLPPATGIDQQSKPAWPWEWDGSDAVVPTTEPDKMPTGEPVYRLRLTGSEDLDLLYEIVQPDGTTDSLPVSLRRSIGLVRLSGDDRNDRDLRLVYGSALDRLLSDKNLRSRISSGLSRAEIKAQLSADGLDALNNLDEVFGAAGLPNGLDLAITGGPGASIASLIGLTATNHGVALPLASWGAGTRRLSALAIAEQKQSNLPIMLVDEIERGLEPYRQRALMEKLQTSGSQVFITTHSPSAISAASQASFWYVDRSGNIGPLDAKTIARHREDDPDCFLSRISIIGEGKTEVGFATDILERAVRAPLRQYGIHVSDGGGHEKTLELLEALVAARVHVGSFADDEGKHPERWKRVRECHGALMFRWPAGCLERNLIAAVPDDKLEALLVDPDGEKAGRRLRTLADRLGVEQKDLPSIRSAAGEDLKSVFVAAALGEVPPGASGREKEFKAHAKDWFKSLAGGQELASKMFELGLWPTFRAQLLPFCNAVRTAIGLGEIPDLDE